MYLIFYRLLWFFEDFARGWGEELSLLCFRGVDDECFDIIS